MSNLSLISKPHYFYSGVGADIVMESLSQVIQGLWHTCLHLCGAGSCLPVCPFWYHRTRWLGTLAPAHRRGTFPAHVDAV